jgi:peptide/nickel transport system ATP-binding protein
MAIEQVDLTINQEEFICILGPSGCGKSTLMKVLLGMIKSPLQVIGGSVTYDFGNGQRDVLALTPSEIRAMRWKDISYIPQGSMNVLWS